MEKRENVKSRESGKTTAQKHSKWPYFYIILGILQVLGVALLFFVILWAIKQAEAGVKGTEAVGFFLFLTLVPAIGIMALINIIGLPIYLARHKPHGRWLFLSSISFIISVILLLYGALQ